MTRMITIATLALALAAAAPLGAAGQEPPAGARTTAPPVDLNAATAEQLETLPGIGERMAERIIEYREMNGGFKKVEELMNVRGIGEQSFLKLRPLVRVGAAPSTGGGDD